MVVEKKKFVGRNKELRLLRSFFEKNIASFVVIKGRRRIGKTELIKQFAKDYRFFSFTGVLPTQQTTKQDQLQDFSYRLQKYFNLPRLDIQDWREAFDFLAAQMTNEPTVILFDEISWMATGDHNFTGIIKNLWDEKLKNHPNLMFIICGSISSWIDHHILKNTGFVGRISHIMRVEELALHECNDFWGKYADQVSAFEKLKLLSVTGGVPRYLEELNASLSSEENIKRLCFQEAGLLFNEFDFIFNDVLMKRTSAYEKIIHALIHQSRSMSDICDVTGLPLNNTTSQLLDELIEAGFLARDFTWHIKSKKQSKLSRYRIKDNYTRFYLRYIEPKKEQIKKERFIDSPLSLLKGLPIVMGLQFENLVINQRLALMQQLNIHPSQVIYDNPFFQTAKMNRKGCQIDYMIQIENQTLYICEIKFSADPVGMSVIDEVKEKISRLQLPRGFSYRPVLIHVNGVSDQVVMEDYFAKIIDFGDFLHLKDKGEIIK